MTEFFSLDAEMAKHDIVSELYNRLSNVRRGLAVKVDKEDEFNLGINCRLANEEEWLLNLIDKIERS